MMLYTTYMNEATDSPHLRNFTALYGRGDVPAAKFEYEFFDEVPVSSAPEVCADKTTLEAAVLEDRYMPEHERFVLSQFKMERPHHVHLKFDRDISDVGDLVWRLPYENLLIQQNLGKLPRQRLIVTVFMPTSVLDVIGNARKLTGYAGAVADQLLVDNL